MYQVDVFWAQRQADGSGYKMRWVGTQRRDSLPKEVTITGLLASWWEGRYTCYVATPALPEGQGA